MTSRELLRSLALNQSENMKSKNKGIERKLLNGIVKKKSLKHAFVITGARRSGKSTLLLQLMEKCYKETDYYYFSFDDERLVDFAADDFEALLEVMIELFGKRKIFFMDEVQNVSGWERFVKRLHDNGFKFIITGSNAHLLSVELSTHLTGRHIDFLLFPFSFEEYLYFCKLYYDNKSLYLTEKKAEISKLFQKYMQYGGFPEMVEENDYEILKRLFEDIVYKDVAVRYKIRDAANLKDIALYLLSNVGNSITYNKIKNSFDLGSVHTAQNYAEYLSNAFLFMYVEIFSYSSKQRLKSPRKVYAIDTGLVNALSASLSKDSGRMLENIVFLELKRRGKEIFYWKNNSGHEVDFVLKEGRKLSQAVQVCYSIDDAETKKREVSALLTCMKHFGLKSGLIITNSFEGEENISGKKIIFMPAWKWLLGI